MLADFLSKALQGSLFRKFRDVLLGLAHLSSLRVPVALLGEGRVVGRVDEPVNNTRESRSGPIGDDADPFGLNWTRIYLLDSLIRTFLFLPLQSLCG